MGGLGKWRN